MENAPNELLAVAELRLAVARLDRQLRVAEDHAADAMQLTRLLAEKCRRLERVLSAWPPPGATGQNRK